MSHRVSALGVVFALFVSLLSGVAATAAGRPDLVVASVGNPPETLEPGWGFIASAKVSNKGGAASKATAVRFYLSLDGTRSADDEVLGSAPVKGIKPKRSASASTAVVIPDSTQLGTYQVVACADDPSKNREANERNNCKAAAGSVEVVAEGPPPNPQSVTPTLDSSAAVTQVVTRKGGELTTTGTNGVTYILTIPNNALLTDEEITMTPLSAVGGLPLTSLIGAVQIEPESVQLLKPATLTIEPVADVPVGEQVGFGAEGTGADFYLDYLAMDASAISLKLTHFSAHGAGRESGGSGAGGRTPTDGEARARDRMSEITREARARGDLTAGDLDALADILGDWFAESVAPNLANGASSNAAADAAISEALSWWKNVELLGLDDALGPELARLKQALKKILEAAIKRAADKCITQNDPEEALNLTKYGKLFEMLGFEGQDVFEKIRKCVRFELKFTSTTTHDVEGEFTYQGLVRVTILLQTEGDPSKLQGFTATATYEKQELAFAHSCAPISGYSFVFAGAAINEAFFGYQLKRDAENDPKPYLSLLFPALPLFDSYTAHIESDQDCISQAFPAITHWGTPFGLLHMNELDLTTGGYLIRDWEVLGGELYAQKVYERTLNQDGAVAGETTKFELFHKPLR